MTKPIEGADCSRGWRWLARDVVGRAHGDEESLFTVLARPIGTHDPWDREVLDALWEDAHRARVDSEARP